MTSPRAAVEIQPLDGRQRHALVVGTADDQHAARALTDGHAVDARAEEPRSRIHRAGIDIDDGRAQIGGCQLALVVLVERRATADEQHAPGIDGESGVVSPSWR